MLTNFDVTNLNRSMEGLGNTFAERRRESEQHERDITQELLRQKMLETEQRRAKTEEDATSNASDRADKEYNLKLMQIGMQQNATGTMTDEGRKAFNEWLLSDDSGHAQAGIQVQAPPKPADPKYGQSALAANQMLGEELRAKAADPKANPEDSKRWIQKAELVESWRPPNEADTATEETDQIINPVTGQPQVDASGQPMTKTKVTRRIKAPQGTLPPTGASAPDPGAGMPQVGQIRKGYQFIGGDPSSQSSWQKIPAAQ